MVGRPRLYGARSRTGREREARTGSRKADRQSCPSPQVPHPEGDDICPTSEICDSGGGSVRSGTYRLVMVGVLLLGFVLVIAVLVCSSLEASFPVALSVVSLFVALMVGAGGGTMVQAILAGGVVLVGGLVLATASDTYEEIRLARRRAKPRRRPRPRVSPVSEAEPELDQQRRAA